MRTKNFNEFSKNEGLGDAFSDVSDFFKKIFSKNPLNKWELLATSKAAVTYANAWKYYGSAPSIAKLWVNRLKKRICVTAENDFDYTEFTYNSYIHTVKNKEVKDVMWDVMHWSTFNTDINIPLNEILEEKFGVRFFDLDNKKHIKFLYEIVDEIDMDDTISKEYRTNDKANDNKDTNRPLNNPFKPWEDLDWFH